MKQYFSCSSVLPLAALLILFAFPSAYSSDLRNTNLAHFQVFYACLLLSALLYNVGAVHVRTLYVFILQVWISSPVSV